MNESKPTVTEAISNVMEDVQAIKKADKNTHQNYMFRGIDAVVNAVGPALRKHGVVVVPISASCESEHFTTAKGAQMRGVTLTVGFRFYGPAGDFVDASVCGEASDSGDKAIPKAHSVAYRTLLLQALCIPTDDPEPDAQTYERGKAQVAAAPKPTAAERKELDTVIAKLKEADPSRDWADIADKYARREFGHGVAALSKDEIGKAVAAMETFLASLAEGETA